MAFSESYFSWDGGVRMGTRVDFTEDDSTKSPRLEPYGGDKRGIIGLNYNNNGLNFRTSFTGMYYGNGYEVDNGAIVLAEEMKYLHPDNIFTFVMNSYLVFGRGGDKGALWFGGAFDWWDRNLPTHKGPTRLWMMYNALANQKLRIYAGYIGREDGDIDDGFNGDWNVSDLVKDEKFIMNPIPWQAALQVNYSGIKNLSFGATFAGEGALAGYKILPDVDGVTDKTRYDFFRSFLWGHTIFGAKYAFPNSLNIGAMLGVDTPWSVSADKYGDTLYHAHLSANYTLTKNLYLHGDIKAVDLTGDRLLFIGVGSIWPHDPYWFELNVKLRDINFSYRKLGPQERLIRVFLVEPVFAWDIIPDSLLFRFPAYVNVDFTGQELSVYIGPGFFYNLRHNGATDDPEHGFVVKYNLGYQVTKPVGAYDHNLELSFRMAF